MAQSGPTTSRPPHANEIPARTIGGMPILLLNIAFMLASIAALVMGTRALVTNNNALGGYHPSR